MLRLSPFVSALLLVSSLPAAASDLREFCEARPDVVRFLVERLDPSAPALEAIRSDYRAGDLAGAAAGLLRHYQASSWVARVERVAHEDEIVLREADDLLRDVFHLLNLEARNPRLPGGGLDWRYAGPENDQEWTFLLNWHLYFRSLLGADALTGDPRYARKFGELIADWIDANPAPSGAPRTRPWRSLEAAMRMSRSWPHAFYGFVSSSEVPPSAKLLMLSAVPGHARVLREHHSSRGNHLLVDMVGLASVALYWPEFAGSADWLEYALETAEREIFRQVYPDGAQKELSNHYQAETAADFQELADLAKLAGRSVTPAYWQRLQSMWDYLARVAKPSGYGPVNNDADAEDNARWVLDALSSHEREDWRYMVTQGERGRPPEGPASHHFPWAGQVVMRSGWERDALWSFFDVGPSGLAHSHYDRLHLSLSAFGRDFLVDNGRYHHKKGVLREYFKGSRGHNVILVDGKGQELRPRSRDRAHADHVVLTDAFDFARGEIAFRDADPRLRHRRAVLRFRDRGWVVVDLLLAFGPHDLEALWHFHPSCTVKAEGLTAVTVDADAPGNLAVLPVAAPDWALEIVTGRAEPTPQGWFSERYNEKVPSPAAVYRARTYGPTVFGWLLWPWRGARPAVRVAGLPSPAGTLRLRIEEPGAAPLELAVRMHGRAPLALSDGSVVPGDLAILEGDLRLHPPR